MTTGLDRLDDDLVVETSTFDLYGRSQAGPREGAGSYRRRQLDPGLRISHPQGAQRYGET